MAAERENPPGTIPKEVTMHRNLFSAIIIALPLVLAAKEVRPMLHFEPLPYDTRALEPHIDAKTMEIHYTRHHRGYFDNLVKAVTGTDLDGKSVEEILAQASRWPEVIRNNAGGHWNHSLFWKLLSPQGGGQPEGELAKRIDSAFGSFEGFRDEFK